MALETFEYPKWGTRITEEMFPLWMLKYLPNMPACHIAIGRDARGPNDSVTVEGTSGLTALAEAARVIERGQADVMITGCTSSRVHPQVWAKEEAYHLSHRINDPAGACRPFDADRDGTVHGEGAGAVIIEERSLAEARGARILATVRGFSSTFFARFPGQPPSKDVVRRAIQAVLADARMSPAEIGHVNADGLGTVDDDRVEAEAIAETLGPGAGNRPEELLRQPRRWGRNRRTGRQPDRPGERTGSPHAKLPDTRPRLSSQRRPWRTARRHSSSALVLSRSRMGHCVAVIVCRP